MWFKFRTIKAVLLLSLLHTSFSLPAQLAPEKEFRAMWVITWEMFRDSQGRPLREQPLRDRIVNILDQIKAGGLNAVLWQVRQGGTVYYPSSLEPWGKWTQYRDPGFDPLAFALEAAKARGLEFHAWVNTFEVSDPVAGTAGQRHPEWVGRDKTGQIMPRRLALSPGIPEARAHTRAVIMEIAKKYEVDGIHLDYIRWSEFPMGESDYPANALPAYQFDTRHPASGSVPAGYNDWNHWRRSMVTTFMRELRSDLLAHERKITLSIAAIGKYNWGGWNGYHFVHQDSALWFNSGLIDHLMPMNYAARTPEKLMADLSGNCPSCWLEHIEEGLRAGRRFSVGVGSYMLHNQDMWNNHRPLMEVIRAHDWVAGVQFFSFGDWEKRQFFRQAPDILWPL